MTIGLEQCDLFLNMLLDNAMGISSKLSAVELMENNMRLWADAAHTNASVYGKDNLGSFDYRLTNLIVGVDLAKDSDSQFGLAIGFGHQSMDEHDLVRVVLKPTAIISVPMV